MPGPEEPVGLGKDDARLTSAWYTMWYRIFVLGPRDVLRARSTVTAARTRRATLARRARH